MGYINLPHESRGFIDLVQQGLRLRTGHRLLVPKGSQAERQAAFLESGGTIGQGASMTITRYHAKFLFRG